MKRITLLLILAASTLGAYAQGQKQIPVKSVVMKRGGKVWIMKGMDENLTMDNGLLVLTDGTVKTADGETAALEEWDCISKEGKLIGLNERKADTVVLKNNNKMWTATKLDKPLNLTNGSSVMPDGTVKTQDGRTIILQEDQTLDLA